MSTPAEHILVGIVIAAVSSWITVGLSLARFRTEKWWERKVSAYERVIEALHHSKAYAEAYLSASEDGRDLPKERDQELQQRSREALLEIGKATDVGGFVFCDETHGRLKQYKKDVTEAAKSEDMHEYVEADLAATESCLSDLIRMAKKDLQTSGKWSRMWDWFIIRLR